MKIIKQLLGPKTQRVLSVMPEMSAFDVAQLMAEKDVGLLVVLKEGRLVGIISERDCVRKILVKEKPPKDTPTSEIMTEQVIYVRPDQRVEECAKLMTEHRIRHLPVLDGEQCVGMLSLGDLMKEMISDQKTMLKQLDDALTGHWGL